MKIIKYLLLALPLTVVVTQYNYSLEDLNSSSETYGSSVRPEYFSNHVTLHYFGHFTWGTCTSRFGELNEIYNNLKYILYKINLIYYIELKYISEYI